MFIICVIAYLLIGFIAGTCLLYFFGGNLNNLWYIEDEYDFTVVVIVWPLLLLACFASVIFIPLFSVSKKIISRLGNYKNEKTN